MPGHNRHHQKCSQTTHSSPDSMLCTLSSRPTSSSHSLSRGPPLSRASRGVTLPGRCAAHSPQKYHSCVAALFMQLHWQFDAEVDARAHGGQDGPGAAHVVT